MSCASSLGLVVAFAFLVPAYAGAAESPPESRPVFPKRIASLTLSPIHLQYPMVELMAEVRVFGRNQRALSVAFIAGYGELSQGVERNNGLVRQTLHPRTGQVGGQLVYYPLEDFRSLQIGGEVLYAKYLGFDLAPDQRMTGFGDGVSIGAFLGYKHVSSNGLTFSGQLGADYMASPNHPFVPRPGKVSVSPSRWYPLLNLNVGWSF